MKFIIEDPEHKLTEREAALRAAEIKSHSSVVGHRRRRRNHLNLPIQDRHYHRVDARPYTTLTAPTHDPVATVLQTKRSADALDTDQVIETLDKDNRSLVKHAKFSPQPASLLTATKYSTWSSVSSIDMFNDTASLEMRSFQFFVERTAREWSGWQDEVMWTTTLPRIASSSSVLRHALTAISAFHESLSSADEDQRKNLLRFSTSQGKKAVETLSRANSDTSLTAAIASYLAIMCFAKFLNYADAFDALKTLHITIDRLQEQPHRFYGKIPVHEWSSIIEDLEPVVDRHRSRFIQLVDSTAALRESPSSHHYVNRRVLVPRKFHHPRQARDCLEDLLNSITYASKENEWPSKYMSPEAQSQVRAWNIAVQELSLKHAESKETQSVLGGLRIAFIMGLITIMTLRSVSEVDYDEYIEEYRDVADDCEFIFDYEMSKGPRFRFALDGGLLVLVGAAARQCRDPHIRERLVGLLEKGWNESAIPSQWHATIAKMAQKIEVRDIERPPTACTDIPAACRVRLFSIFFYEQSEMVQLQFLHFPYEQNQKLGNYEVVRLQFTNQIQYEFSNEPSPMANAPQALFGPSSVTWHRKSNVAGSTYYTLSMRRFYFNIPRS